MVGVIGRLLVRVRIPVVLDYNQRRGPATTQLLQEMAENVKVTTLIIECAWSQLVQVGNNKGHICAFTKHVGI